MENIYIINWDENHLIDVELDVMHVPYKNSNDFPSDIIDDFEFEHPEIMLFKGNYDVFEETDYLINDLRSPMFSKKLIDTLESIGDFKHKRIPCGIVDFTIDTKKAFDDFDNYKLNVNTVLNRDYEILHILEYTDALDYEKSDLEMDEDDPEEVFFINNMVLKEPEEGFPPIFRIDERASKLFITETVKNELDAAGIQGILYEKI